VTITNGLQHIRDAGYHGDMSKYLRVSEQLSLKESIREAHYIDGQINRSLGRLCECRECKN